MAQNYGKSGVINPMILKGEEQKERPLVESEAGIMWAIIQTQRGGGRRREGAPFY